jgi:hypothetical protein
MAVLSNTGTVTPVVGVETDVAAIVPGAPLDTISVYVEGGLFGAGGFLEYALYATVGGFRTRVAQAQIVGSATPSLIAWQTVGRGDGQTEDVFAGGTTYTVTVIDLSTQLTPLALPRQPVTVTIAGVNDFDTAADQNFGALLVVNPAVQAFLTTFTGYNQLMDVAIDQTNLPSVTVIVSADNGPGSVQAEVATVTMSGKDETIASVFRGLKLPVATRYFVSVTNNTGLPIAVTLTGVTYSVSFTSGGAVILNGDVVGPSAANTVIKWDNVPLTLAGLGSFGGPADAAIPIFDSGTGFWRALVLSGGATMTDAGVVTINPAGITLGGDVTGPAGANTVGKWDNVPLLTGAVANSFDLGQLVDAAIPIYDSGTGRWRQFPLSGQVTMTDAGVVTVTGATVTLGGDVTGPSGANTVVKWENVPLLAGAAPGFGAPVDGAVGIYDAGLNEWRTFALSGGATMTNAGVVTVTGPITLAGNAEGPSNANSVVSRGIEAVNRNVLAAEFTPASGIWYVGISGLTGNVTVTIPDMTSGSQVIVKDEDGSIGNGFSITVVSATGKTIDGNASYVVGSPNPGPQDANTFLQNFNAPTEWAVI